MSHFRHENKTQFIEAVRETARRTGFSGGLIEKDYYCSLILKEIFQSEDCNLVFKGGTLLNKVHAGFYRLSEDLDFSIDAKPNLARKKRRALAHIAKKCVEDSAKRLSLNIIKPFKGQNESRSYNAAVEYYSVVFEDKLAVKIEFAVQENILEEENLMAQTLLKDPLTQKPVLPDFSVKGLSLKETYSEKIRAALSRVTPAIRDIFDIHYAVKNHLIDIKDMIPMIKHKLDILDRTIDLSDNRRSELLTQFQENLLPVLRKKDFEEFDFEQAWNLLKNIENSVMSENYIIELCGEAVKYRLTSIGSISFDIPKNSKLDRCQWQAGLNCYTKKNGGRLKDFRTGTELLPEKIKKSLIEKFADEMGGNSSKKEKIKQITFYLNLKKYPPLKHEAEFWAIVQPLKGAGITVEY